MLFIKKNIKASALGYAISFLLLVGLICTGVIAIASTQKRLEINYSIEEHLVFDNLFALNYGAKQTTNGKKTHVHLHGDTSEITVKNWGAFRVVVAHTYHGNRKVKKSALIGRKSQLPLQTIYLPDQRQVLKLCGDTKIYGNVSLSEQGAERGYIAGKRFVGDKLIHGNQKKSERHLPPISKTYKNLQLNDFTEDSERIELPIGDSTFSFENPTSLVSKTGAIYIQNKFIGNLIIHSFESITVSSSAELKHVILIAPRIVFETGFRGNVQALAHESIELQQDVELMYPSTLVLNELSMNASRTSKSISLAEGSMVVGGILLTSQHPNFRAPIQLKLDKATVGGLVYNQGETMVVGKLHGFVFTNSFFLQTGSGEYKNHLLDAEIRSDNLPEMYLPPWFEEQSGINEVITWF